MKYIFKVQFTGTWLKSEMLNWDQEYSHRSTDKYRLDSKHASVWMIGNLRAYHLWIALHLLTLWHVLKFTPSTTHIRQPIIGTLSSLIRTNN